MIHKLKILPEFFPLVEKGKKRFELRKNDRNYQEDDILLLQEYFDGEYTGRQCVVKITNVFGSNNEESLWPELKKETIISDQYVILSIKKINVPIEILMEIERPMEQGYTNSFNGEEVDAEVIIVEDTKQLGEGTAAFPPPSNPWASKNRKQTDDSDNDGQ